MYLGRNGDWAMRKNNTSKRQNYKLNTREESQECEMRDMAASCGVHLHTRALLQNTSCGKAAQGPMTISEYDPTLA